MKKRIHYGWWVALGGCLMMFYGYGLALHSFSVFLPHIIERLNVTTAEGSSIVSVQNIASTVSILFSGILYSKFSARKVTGACGCLFVLGYVIYAFSDSLLMCYVGAAVIGLGYGSGTIFPASLLINRWFHKKRGFVLSLASAGSGLAAVIFPPVISNIIMDRGLSTALLFQGGCIAVMVLVMFLLVRDRPQDMGMDAYGADEIVVDVKKRASELVRKPSFSEVIRQPRFYIFLASHAFLFVSVLAVLTYNSLFYITAGYSSSFSASMVSLYGAVLIGGKLLYGLMIDKSGNYKANRYIFALYSITFLFSTLVGKFSASPYLFSILMGLSVPIGTIPIPLWTMDLFGEEAYTSAYSIVRIVGSVFNTLGVTFAGYLCDKTGTLTLPYLAFAACTVISFWLLQALYRNADKESKHPVSNESAVVSAEMYQ